MVQQEVPRATLEELAREATAAHREEALLQKEVLIELARSRSISVRRAASSASIASSRPAARPLRAFDRLASAPAAAPARPRSILRSVSSAPNVTSPVAEWLGDKGQVSAHAIGKHVKFHEEARTRQLDKDGALLLEEKRVPLSRKESTKRTLRRPGMSGRTRQYPKLVDELSLLEATSVEQHDEGPVNSFPASLPAPMPSSAQTPSPSSMDIFGVWSAIDGFSAKIFSAPPATSFSLPGTPRHVADSKGADGGQAPSYNF